MPAPADAFDTSFVALRAPLLAYLYRLTASRTDAEDLCHDTYVRAASRYATFEGRSSLRTWVFRIATNLARDHRRAASRWPADAQDRGREQAMSDPERYRSLSTQWSQGRFEAREHIDYCFTCIARSLPLEEQVALLLKDVFAFKNREVAAILGGTEARAKHLLHQARSALRRIFDGRCSLVNRAGTCYQCSELCGALNPERDAAAELARLELVRAALDPRGRDLLALRAELVRSVDPLAPQTALHAAFLARLHDVLGT